MHSLILIFILCEFGYEFSVCIQEWYVLKDMVHNGLDFMKCNYTVSKWALSPPAVETILFTFYLQCMTPSQTYFLIIIKIVK